jgi:hypothetical protein
MFCYVTTLLVYVLYCEWYVYMFCIVNMVCVHVFYCDSGTRTCFVL